MCLVAMHDRMSTRMKTLMRPGSRYLTAWNRLARTWMRMRCGMRSFCTAASALSIVALFEGEYSMGWTKGSVELGMDESVPGRE